MNMLISARLAPLLAFLIILLPVGCTPANHEEDGIPHAAIITPHRRHASAPAHHVKDSLSGPHPRKGKKADSAGTIMVNNGTPHQQLAMKASLSLLVRKGYSIFWDMFPSSLLKRSPPSIAPVLEKDDNYVHLSTTSDTDGVVNPPSFDGIDPKDNAIAGGDEDEGSFHDSVLGSVSFLKKNILPFLSFGHVYVYQ